jgi:hypothetical protein
MNATIERKLRRSRPTHEKHACTATTEDSEMAKRKKQAAAVATREESSHAREYASEIRLRETDLYQERGEDRDTEPAPPPVFDQTGSVWSDLDRELTMCTLRLEDALHDCTSLIGAAHVRLVLEDADALADSLFALWSQTREKRPSWSAAVTRVYRWARDVVEQLEEALVVGPNDDREIKASFHLLASYSSLFVQGLIEPALRAAVAHADHAEHADEAERLRVVSERIGLLDWTVTCAASEPA